MIGSFNECFVVFVYCLRRKKVDEGMNGRMEGRMGEWMNEWMNVRLDELYEKHFVCNKWQFSWHESLAKANNNFYPFLCRLIWYHVSSCFHPVSCIPLNVSWYLYPPCIMYPIVCIYSVSHACIVFIVFHL